MFKEALAKVVPHCLATDFQAQSQHTPCPNFSMSIRYMADNIMIVGGGCGRNCKIKLDNVMSLYVSYILQCCRNKK